MPNDYDGAMQAIPMLPSRDLDATIAFYSRLGFSCARAETDPRYAMCARGGLELHFFAMPAHDPATSCAGCYLRVEDADALYQELAPLGLSRLHRIEDTPWGMREFNFVDPDGNLIRIGHDMVTTRRGSDDGPRSAVRSLAGLELVLRTERLTLRPIEVADADALWPYVSDPELPRHMTWAAHRDVDETKAFLTAAVRARAADTDIIWLLVHEDAAAGVIGLHGIQRTMRAWQVDRAELGYWVAPPLHGRGLATEAGRAVLRFGFAGLRLHKITVGCVSENVGSRRVIEKLGFRAVGAQRDHFFRDGRWQDHLSFELCAGEWAPA